MTGDAVFVFIIRPIGASCRLYLLEREAMSLSHGVYNSVAQRVRGAAWR